MKFPTWTLPLMPTQFAWKIAAPMIALGTVLLGLGVFAAWNVREQHQKNSELITAEVHGIEVTARLRMLLEQLKAELSILVADGDRSHLEEAERLNAAAAMFFVNPETISTNADEQKEFTAIGESFGDFEKAFQTFLKSIPAGRPEDPVSGLDVAALQHLSGSILTATIINPLNGFMRKNEGVVERSNEASRETTQHLKVGFLLLGICGGGAGLLLGLGIARAVGRSIVQLNVSVRGAAGKLAYVTGPVTFSHSGDLVGVETGLRKLESDIADVVERLQQRETELLRSEQLARVGQLAAGLAHELRNPLMPMKMLVQSALEKGPDAGLNGRALHVIREEIGRLEVAIQSFLDFARPPVVEKTEANVGSIIDQTVNLIQVRADQLGVKIVRMQPAAGLMAKIDSTQIRQLLLNLLLNALDALSQGGRLEIRLDPNSDACDPPSGPIAATAGLTDSGLLPAKLQVATPSKKFSICVTDDGPGIPAPVLDQIFEPFVTTKETGTGLGLSICHRIAEAHGGDLIAFNRPEGGASFLLTLPYEL